MNRRMCGLMTALMLACSGCGLAEESKALRLAQTIPLPDVSGRIDHMAVDAAGSRLFVAALGNGTVEVIDLREGKRVHTIQGLREPQGVAYAAEAGRLYVACAGDGTCKVFDGRSFDLLATLDFKDDADNLRCDPKAGQVFVGYGSGAIGAIEAASGKRVADFKLAGHPEAFALEAGGSRIFVNVPTARQVAVIDRKKGAVVATWPLVGARSNFPMALDEATHRLFVACRHPAKLLVFDTETGKSVADLPIGGDADDVFCDAKRRHIYVSCGAGSIHVVEQIDADHYGPLGQVSTAAGARTSYFVPQLDRLYLAVPASLLRKAELRVYEVLP